ncbi:MAG: SLBB domain-containing protein [Syntrophothermus sp.]
MIKKSALLFLLVFSSLFAQERSGSSSSSMLFSGGGISVTIGGSFIVTGSFPASPMERVDQFITRIYTQVESQRTNLQNQQRENVKSEDNVLIPEEIAKRNIILKRLSGEQIVIDLDRFRLTGDFTNNPYLKNDDVLIFPKLDLTHSFVIIDGAVNNPAKFQFVDGDRLSDALLFSQGINKAYENVTQAEITRLSYDGQKDEVLKVDINSNFPLQRGDRIRILADEMYKKDYKVLVLGRVNRPGYIYIAKDNTTLKDVVNKAGGFAKNASLADAELIRGIDNSSLLRKDILTKSFEQNYEERNIERQLLENRQIERLSMLRTGYFVEFDTAYFRVDDQLRVLRSTASIDFTRLEDPNSNASNFKVKDGDVIVVPERKEFVYVYGQVAVPGYIPYVDGKDVKYYLQKAGGIGEQAKDFDEISIIKGKSREWIPITDKNVKLEPGDYIWVPKETPKTFDYYFNTYMGRIGTVASIVGTIVTIILLSRKQ